MTRPEYPILDRVARGEVLVAEAKHRYDEVKRLAIGFQKMKYWEDSIRNLNPLKGAFNTGTRLQPHNMKKEFYLGEDAKVLARLLSSCAEYTRLLDAARRDPTTASLDVRPLEEAEQAVTSALDDVYREITRTCQACTNWMAHHVRELEDAKDKSAGLIGWADVASQAVTVGTLCGTVLGTAFGGPIGAVAGAAAGAALGGLVSAGNTLATRYDRTQRGAYSEQAQVAASIQGTDPKSTGMNMASYFKDYGSYAVSGGKKVASEVLDHAGVATNLISPVGQVVSAHVNIAGRVIEGMQDNTVRTQTGSSAEQALASANFAMDLKQGANITSLFKKYDASAPARGEVSHDELAATALTQFVDTVDKSACFGNIGSFVTGDRGDIKWPIDENDYSWAGPGGSGFYRFDVTISRKDHILGQYIPFLAHIQLGTDGAAWIDSTEPDDDYPQSSPWRDSRWNPSYSGLSPEASAGLAALGLSSSDTDIDYDRYLWHIVDQKVAEGTMLESAEDGGAFSPYGSFDARNVKSYVSNLPQQMKATLLAVEFTV